MKYIISILFACVAMISQAQSQGLPQLFNKNWKVESSKVRLHSEERYLYHMDSAQNQQDYTNFVFVFAEDGTYKIKFSTDEDTGTWANDVHADTFLLDNGRYFIQTLNEQEFELVGYAVRPNMASLASAQSPEDMLYDTIFNHFKLIGLSALPVSFAGFTATFKQSKVLLEWQTASESNNSHFEIEHSSDNKQFIKIGSMPGNGTSSVLHQYHLATNRFQHGDNFYRIKQVDLDGKHTYSPIAVLNVDLHADQKMLSLAPNPATTFIHLNWKGTAGTSVYVSFNDFTGRVVWKTTVILKAGDNRLNLSPLAKGLYVVSVKDEQGNNVFKDKLLVQ